MEAIGCGFHEAVRGVLSHHVVIRDGKIANYHPYPPTPWNASPREAAVPTLAARLHITNALPVEPIHSISLNCQIQIQPLGRKYTAEEEARLLDLFGERERWARTMKPMLWTITVLKVPGFKFETELDISFPCRLDFDVAATKYFYGLQQGVINASVLFSGTIFYADQSGTLQVAQIPWDREARLQIPVEKWSAAIDSHYPNSTWLRLSRETFDRLYRYKVSHSVPMWDKLIERLLDEADRSAEDRRSSGETLAVNGAGK